MRSPPRLGWPLWSICVTNDHGYDLLVVNTSRSFPHSRLITGFVTRLTLRLSLVEQELFTLQEHLSSSPGFSGVRVTRSLVLYACFVDCCLFFCIFLLAIVLSVLLRYTDYDCPFIILKLFYICPLIDRASIRVVVGDQVVRVIFICYPPFPIFPCGN